MSSAIVLILPDTLITADQVIIGAVVNVAIESPYGAKSPKSAVRLLERNETPLVFRLTYQTGDGISKYYDLTGAQAEFWVKRNRSQGDWEAIALYSTRAGNIEITDPLKGSLVVYTDIAATQLPGALSCHLDLIEDGKRRTVLNADLIVEDI